jgi:hypothetical protein
MAALRNPFSVEGTLRPTAYLSIIRGNDMPLSAYME